MLLLGKQARVLYATETWCFRQGSNLRLPPCQGGGLTFFPTEAGTPWRNRTPACGFGVRLVAMTLRRLVEGGESNPVLRLIRPLHFTVVLHLVGSPGGTRTLSRPLKRRVRCQLRHGGVVAPTGFEPASLRLKAWYPSCRPRSLGTGGRIRTHNPLLNREPHYHCATPVCLEPAMSSALISVRLQGAGPRLWGLAFGASAGTRTPNLFLTEEAHHQLCY